MATPFDPVAWVKRYEELGAGYIVSPNGNRFLTRADLDYMSAADRNEAGGLVELLHGHPERVAAVIAEIRRRRAV
jgi:hypothetical protein